MSTNSFVKQKKAYVYALFAILFWSTISSAFKITLRYVSFDELLLWSVIFAIVVLGMINQTGKNPLRKADLSKRSLMSSATMGFFNPFLYYLVLSKAYDLLEAQEAMSLNYIWPVVLVLFSIIFLKQKIKWIAICALFISFFGILVIITDGNITKLNFHNPLGISLALGSALFWATYWILNMIDKREDTGKILLNLTFGLIFILLYFLLTDRKVSIPSVKGLAGCLYIGIFEMSITFVVWLRALNFSKDTAKVSNLVYFSPFLALFWIRLTVGESIRLSTVAGLAFIIFGIVLQQIFSRRKNIITNRK